MAAPVVLHGDAQQVVIEWLRSRLDGATLCSELPDPDELAALLPLVEVALLPSGPSQRVVHTIPRIEVVVRTAAADGAWPACVAFAGFVAAQTAAMGGRAIAVPATDHTPAGTVAVTQVARVSAPAPYPEANDGIYAASFTCEPYLRPLRVA